MEVINIAGAKSHFSELISRAASGERFIIQRRQRPVAVRISMVEIEIAAGLAEEQGWLLLSPHCFVAA